MATNVFGNPITTSTLRGMLEYRDKEVITRLDLARVAINMKNTGGNDLQVRKYVEDIGKEMLQEPSTFCVLYNATGGTISFVSIKNWDKGHLANTPVPATIANGQWGGFVHVNPLSSALDSRASVVYRAVNDKGETWDILITWQNPSNREVRHNRVFTETHHKGHYDDNAFKIIDSYLTEPTEGFIVHRCEWSGFSTTVSTGNARKGAFVEAIYTLEHAHYDSQF